MKLYKLILLFLFAGSHFAAAYGSYYLPNPLYTGPIQVAKGYYGIGPLAFEKKYDASGHIINETYYTLMGEIKSTSRYQYNSDGRLTSLTSDGQEGSFTTSYIYNEGLLVRETTVFKTQKCPSSYATHTYDEKGLETDFSLYDLDSETLKRSTISEYNDKGLISRTAEKNGNTLVSFYTDYFYDSSGNLTKSTISKPDGEPVTSQTWSYDSNNHIISWKELRGNSIESEMTYECTFDARGNLTSYKANGKWGKMNVSEAMKFEYIYFEE